MFVVGHCKLALCLRRDMAGKSSRSAHKTAAGGRADYPLDAGRAEAETSGKPASRRPNQRQRLDVAACPPGERAQLSGQISGIQVTVARLSAPAAYLGLPSRRRRFRLKIMRKQMAVAGRLLHSVALRYRHPLADAHTLGIIGILRNGCVTRPFAVMFPAPGGPASPINRAGRLEAMLSLSRQPLTSRKLAQLTGLADGTKARTRVRGSNRRYDLAGSAFRVEEVAGGYKLMTRSKFAPWLRRLHSAKAQIGLSASAMETLAIVAYRQPAMRAEIEAIRGVQSGEVLRQLIERDLVRIAGRSNELGAAIPLRDHKTVFAGFRIAAIGRTPESPGFPDPRRPGALRENTPTPCDSNSLNRHNPSPVPGEEENAMTLSTKTQSTLAEDQILPSVRQLPGDDWLSSRSIVAAAKEEDDFEEEDEEFEDEEDEEFEDEEEEEEEEEDDEDLDNEPWEEVEDNDEEEEERTGRKTRTGRTKIGTKTKRRRKKKQTRNERP